MKQQTKGPGLLRGARRIARYVFDDENEYRKIYGLREALGLFPLNGMLCGLPATIDERLAQYQRDAAQGESTQLTATQDAAP